MRKYNEGLDEPKQITVDQARDSWEKRIPKKENNKIDNEIKKLLHWIYNPPELALNKPPILEKYLPEYFIYTGTARKPDPRPIFKADVAHNTKKWLTIQRQKKVVQELKARQCMIRREYESSEGETKTYILQIMGDRIVYIGDEDRGSWLEADLEDFFFSEARKFGCVIAKEEFILKFRPYEWLFKPSYYDPMQYHLGTQKITI